MEKGKKIVKSFIITFIILIVGVLVYNSLNVKKGVSREILTSRKYEQVESGDEKVDNSDFVTFDAFYLRDLDGDGYAEKIRGSCRKIGESDTLYFDLGVNGNGTLKNAKLTIDGKNFYYYTTLVKDSVISKDYISNNTREIVLNDVSSGTQKLIFGLVRSGDYVYYKNVSDAIGKNVNNYSISDNSVTLTGTHVADDGTETPISKTVYFTNDWYGETTSEFYMTDTLKRQVNDIERAIDEDNNQLKIEFKVETWEEKYNLLISSAYVYGELPEINGYAATGITCSNVGSVATYDAQTKMFNVTISSTVDENGNVSSKLDNRNRFTITAYYPLEAYTSSNEKYVSLNIPLKAGYDGYNNPNDGYDNPYHSNIAEDTIDVIYQEHPRVDVVYNFVGKYLYDRELRRHRYVVSKKLPINMYSNTETENEERDIYKVEWNIYANENIQGIPLVLKDNPDEVSDKFKDSNDNYISMENYVSYAGIYFSGNDEIIEDDGYIKVYNNDTNELIHTFTKSEIIKYNENTTYWYPENIKHIRIETSAINPNIYFDIYNLKEIDDEKLTTDFTREEFDSFEQIYSYVSAYRISNDELIELDSDFHLAEYEEPYSLAKIKVEPSYITNQETNSNVVINILSDVSKFNTEKWGNAVFLIKYPQEVIDVNIKNTILNDEDIQILGIDTYEEDGNLYTKVYVANDVEKDIDIKLVADITANPRSVMTSRELELYFNNELFDRYFENVKVLDVYDLDGDGDTQDYIGKDTTEFTITAPIDILTSQTITDFDDLGSIAIAPKDATIDKASEERTAKVNINLVNNYSSTISEVKILGSIPFEGNKYIFSGKDLGSKFDTTITQEGIILPEELQGIATVYYSEKETVTNDINARRNAWTTTPSDMSKVKNYLIDFGNYVLSRSDVKTISYNITIPTGIDYNDVSYSEYAVYYCLDTDEGKIQTQVEPNRLGVRIASKYDLQITKYKSKTSTPIAGTVISATDVETGESKITTTISTGVATFTNLYAEKEYIVKEIKANQKYVLDETETRIIGHIVEGQLQFEVTGGNFATTPVVTDSEFGNKVVTTTIENELKYNLELNKTELETDVSIKGIKFELTDYNGKKKEYTTNKYGKLVLEGLEPYRQYNLTEIDSKGHYVKDSISFVMNRDNNDALRFDVVSGEFDYIPVIDETSETPVVRVSLVNEVIPTYSLRITKKESETEDVIQGAQFKIEGEGKQGTYFYESDSNGQIIIPNLYSYVDGKDIEGIYTLTEVYAGEGYVKSNTPIVFKLTKNNNNYDFDLISGTIREEIENVQIDTTDENNPIVNITIDNDPVFTLTKVDAETGLPLEGVEFKITDTDGNEAIRDANGNYVNNVELFQPDFEPVEWSQYPFEQREDGVWQSTNYGTEDDYSAMWSEPIVVTERSTLTYEIASSGGDISSWVNVADGDGIWNENMHYIDSKVRRYEKLKFKKLTVTLEPGMEYRLGVSYNRNNGAGLDRGFLRNVYVVKGNSGLKTDSNGKIRLSLTEGMYKVIETKPLEGYALPENYTGIGIGASKEAEYQLEYNNKIGNEIFVERKKLFKSDTGYIIVGKQAYDFYLNNSESLIKLYEYDDNENIVNNINLPIQEENFADYSKDYEPYVIDLFKKDNYYYWTNGYKLYKSNSSGNTIWENNDYYLQEETIEDSWWNDGFKIVNNRIIGIHDNNDGIIIVLSSGIFIKYDYDGNILWTTEEKGYNIRAVASNNEEVLAVTIDGTLVKFDLSGNVIWEKSIYSVEYEDGAEQPHLYYEYTPEIRIFSDGSIAVLGGNNNRYLYKLDSTGTQLWEKDNNGASTTFDVINQNILLLEYGEIKILGNDGSVLSTIDTNRIGGRCSQIIANEDYMVAIDILSSKIKCDYIGNIITTDYGNRFDNYSLTSDSNMIVAVSSDGIISAYDSDYNLLWKNVDYYNRINFLSARIANNYIYVLSENSILKYDLEGNYIDEIYNATHMQMAKTDDGFYVLNQESKIIKYNYQLEEEWSKTYSSYIITSISNTEDGFVATTYDGYILEFDDAGNLLGERTQLESRLGIIKTIEDGYVVVARNGIVYKLDTSFILIESFEDYYDGWIDSNDEEFDASDDKWENYYYNTDFNFDIINTSIYLYRNMHRAVYVIDLNLNDSYDISGNSDFYSATSNGDDIIFACGDGTLKIYDYQVSEPEIQASTSIVIENEYAWYKIKTSVNGTGGTISGMYDEYYEEVKYMQDSTKSIVITPNNGYEISTITINGQRINYVEDENGIVTLDQFTEVKEDKEIVVTFVNKDKSLVINKLDSTNDNPLENAVFNIKEVDTREEPNVSEIIGEIVSNGPEVENFNLQDEVTGVVGELQVPDGAEYYFVQNGSSYESNNQYQDNSTATSYVKIDLQGYEGDYALVVNADIDSEYNFFDYGYAIVTDSEDIPAYDYDSSFIHLSGQEYSHTATKKLEGGNTYYVHFGYSKDGGGDSGEDKFTINSINVYEAEVNTTSYYFVDNGNGGYESNNQNANVSVASSYIPIDLTNYSGKYSIKVNADIYCQNEGVNSGVIFVKDNEYISDYYNDWMGENYLVYLDKTTLAKDYSVDVDGGSVYYLHFIHFNGDDVGLGNNKLSINNITVERSQAGMLDTEIITNAEGKASIELPDGKYEIMEVKAPDGYTLNKNKIVHDFVAGGENEFTIRDNPQVDLVVHHYLKGTTTSVADDEYIKGDLDTEYSTSPKMELEDYIPEKDVNGNYILPENSSGTYTLETQVVTYYYVEKPLKLIVHHFIDGTRDSIVDDEEYELTSGESYQTNPITSPELDERYYLNENRLPENASGIANDKIIEVTYYYSTTKFRISTGVEGIGGTVSGQNSDYIETVSYGSDSKADIIVKADYGYQIKQVKINNEVINLSNDKLSTYVVDKFKNVTEDKQIIVEFEHQTVEYVVYKGWEDNEDALGKRPSSVAIDLYNDTQFVERKILTSDNVFREPNKVNVGYESYEENPGGWSYYYNETYYEGQITSGNIGNDDTISYQETNTINAQEGTKVYFDWAVSSEQDHDFLAYTLIKKNEDTQEFEVVGGDGISGTSQGVVYEDLEFNHVELELDSGEYKIEFRYIKDDSGADGLDLGVIKNLCYTDGSYTEYSDLWVTTFNVPLVDDYGNSINYYVRESEVNLNDLQLYNSECEYIDENSTYFFKGNALITNTFDIPDTTIDIGVTNNWDDNSNQNGKRPEQVKIQLKVLDEVIREQLINVEGDSQTYTFTGLSVFNESGDVIQYTIDEVEVNADDLKFYSKEINQDSHTITNVFTVPGDKVEKTVTINWNDNSNATNTRPNQIKVQIKNGNNVIQEYYVQSSANNTQTYNFSNLPKYDSNGNEITYTASVESITGYSNSSNGLQVNLNINNYTITSGTSSIGGTVTETSEEVSYNGTSTQDIVITPSEGYQISSIRVNNVEQTLPDNKDQVYTLPKFTNVTESKNVEVTFEKRPYTINVQLSDNNGNVNGQESFTETVLYGESSIEDIVITPNSTYKIYRILIDGDELEFTPENDGTYTLPKFVNVTSNKSIEVEFDRKDTSILVKHVDENSSDLLDPETISGKIGDSYTTSARDFESYDLKTTPENASGVMTEQQIVITYVYSKVLGKVTVIKKDSTTNQRLEGAQFIIEKLNDSNEVDTNFEAVTKTTNENGVLEFNNLEVGKYRVTEIKAVDDYELSGNAQDVEISKSSRSVTIESTSRLKIVLPSTGEKYRTIVILVNIIGVTFIISSIMIKKYKTNN